MSRESDPDHARSVAAAREIVDLFPEPTLILELDGTITHANPAASELLGAGASIVGRSLAEVAEDAAHVQELLGSWRRGGHLRPGAVSFPAVGRLRASGARLRRLPSLVVRFQEPHAADVAFRAVEKEVEARNLREVRSRLERTVEELHTTNRRLAAANEELQQYAAIVSHDLRTPLITIAGFADLLESELDEEQEEARDYVGAILRAARHLQRVIDGLLSLTRLTVSEPADEPGRVEDAAHEALGHVRTRYPEVDAEVDIASSPDVGVAPAHLTQILGNLLENSHKFRAEDRPLRIAISGRFIGEHVEITVEDNGIGVAEPDRERIFELMHRGTTVVDRPGTGIGLAAVRKIVRSYGGDIRCEPRHPGTALILTLPAA